MMIGIIKGQNKIYLLFHKFMCDLAIYIVLSIIY